MKQYTVRASHDNYDCSITTCCRIDTAPANNDRAIFTYYVKNVNNNYVRIFGGCGGVCRGNKSVARRKLGTTKSVV